jgi:hypothetical protein
MPQDFYCERCGLVFSAGFYGVRSHFPARTLLVCQSCGTCHEVRYPLNDKRSPCLLSQSGPLIRSRRPSRPVFLDRRLKWVEQPLPAGEEFADPRSFGTSIVKLACPHCDAVGTLRSNWEADGKACPNCRSGTPVVTGSWIT